MDDRYREDIRHQFHSKSERVRERQAHLNCEMGGNDNNADYTLFTPNEIEQQRDKLYIFY